MYLQIHHLCADVRIRRAKRLQLPLAPFRNKSGHKATASVLGTPAVGIKCPAQTGPSVNCRNQDAAIDQEEVRASCLSCSQRERSPEFKDGPRSNWGTQMFELSHH